ncbi:MAG: excinuclease ABC subunit UvrA [Bacteroidales bacterium]|nr:excinuclease ABC subunit UvrA [Bacteroidales bacterium]
MARNSNIEVRNARANNLKGIDIDIPRNKLIVVTGVSGSGKSSLAFDTLYAEGQRRYVESLNSYARQFLGRNSKPDVDSIHGIPPAIAIEQKVNTRNPRSTVGTSTEIYDYLRLLFARVGHTYSPISGAEVRHDSVTDVVDYVLRQPIGTKVMILSEIAERGDIEEYAESLKVQGFSRIEVEGKVLKLSKEEIASCKGKKVNLVVDRVVVAQNADTTTRLSDSVATAMQEGHGTCVIRILKGEDEYIDKSFSVRFEADGMTFEEPTEMMFTFNSPMGACPECEGFGRVIGIDEDLVIPNKQLSVSAGCVACWVGAKLSEWKTDFILSSARYNFPVHKAYEELTDAEKKLLWDGGKGVNGINDFFRFVASNQYKIQYRIIQARFRGKTVCPVCHGTRLRKEAGYVRVGGKNISEVCSMPISELRDWLNALTLNEYEAKVAERVLTEIKQRTEFLCEVGLDYLTLDRMSATLSGGESQRINLATSLGSSLVGSLYILDEPSIGLHSADTDKLINVLRKLQKIGNTVLVVEHDEDIIRSADDIIDIGPEAGRLGGEVVFSGSYTDLLKKSDSLTAKYLTGKMGISVPTSRRVSTQSIELKGVSINNLKNVDVRIPLNVLTVVTGVSGSGKSSLITQVLYPELRESLQDGLVGSRVKTYKHLSGDLSAIKAVDFVDQNPIGKSTRSNPVTYLKAYEEIRKLMSNQPMAKQNGYTAAHFSFNAQGGRCDACQGDGYIKIEMQFMADVIMQCEQCHGKRFKDDILEVKYRGKNIYDILEMTVNQAIEFFSESDGAIERKIVQRLRPLQVVGIGYIKLGQSSSTLSGGENQRVKLASYIAEENNPPTLFIFDEPTTGLHFHDISKLIKAFGALIEKGHSIVIIEHNMDIIKSADWIIDMGPKGGKDGGQVVAVGTPEEVSKVEESQTAKYLRQYLEGGDKYYVQRD